MSIKIVTGNDYSIAFTVKLNDAAVSIDPSATVRALISSLDRETVLQAAVTCISSATGADWPNGVVIIPFTAAQTAAITSYKSATLELQVDDSGKSEWTTIIEIEKGNL